MSFVVLHRDRILAARAAAGFAQWATTTAAQSLRSRFRTFATRMPAACRQSVQPSRPTEAKKAPRPHRQSPSGLWAACSIHYLSNRRVVSFRTLVDTYIAPPRRGSGRQNKNHLTCPELSRPPEEVAMFEPPHWGRDRYMRC